MDNKEKTIQLKKELLELEDLHVKDVVPRGKDKVMSGFISLAISLIMIAFGFANELTPMVLMGFVLLIFGIILMVYGKNILDDFENETINLKQRIVEIKKDLLDLE